jgi:cobaltochelatase CobS
MHHLPALQLKVSFQMHGDCTPSHSQDHAEVFRMLAGAVQEHLHAPAVDADTVRQIASDVVDEKLSQVTLPRPLEVHLPDGTVNRIEGPAHRQLRELLELVEEGHHNLMMVGPAGSGKTTLAKNLAAALGLEYGFISLSAGVSETHLLGRTLPESDGAWRFKPGRFVQIYEAGGVYLLDEIDAADANVMVAINAALANGQLVTTDGVIHYRHAHCFIIAAGNTWGRGGDHQYVGRNQLDAATLDRFVLCTLHIDYDRELEQALVKASLPAETGSALIQWVENLRTSIARNRLRRIASTRLIVNAIAALAKGRSLETVQVRYFQDWSADEKAKVCNA